jgi:hypothetical protein
MCDVCIVDAVTGKVCKLPCSGYRQEVVAINDESSEFATLTTRGRQAAFRIYGFNGELRRQMPCPQQLRNRSIWDGFAATKEVGKLIYRKNETGHLYTFDCRTGDETLVCRNIASSAQWDSIKGLEWLSETKVLLLLNVDKRIGRERAAVDILDIITKERRTIYWPEYIGEYAVSLDRENVAIIDGRWQNATLHVVNIGTGKVVSSTEQGDYCHVCWGWKDIVGYVAEYTAISILPLENQAPHSIYVMPAGFSCYALVIGNGWFAVNSRVTPTPIRTPSITPMHIYDLATCKNMMTVNEPFNGRWFIADKGAKIICETGF